MRKLDCEVPWYGLDNELRSKKVQSSLSQLVCVARSDRAAAIYLLRVFRHVRYVGQGCLLTASHEHHPAQYWVISNVGNHFSCQYQLAAVEAQGSTRILRHAAAVYDSVIGRRAARWGLPGCKVNWDCLVHLICTCSCWLASKFVFL